MLPPGFDNRAKQIPRRARRAPGCASPLFPLSVAADRTGRSSTESSATIRTLLGRCRIGGPLLSRRSYDRLYCCRRCKLCQNRLARIRQVVLRCRIRDRLRRRLPTSVRRGETLLPAKALVSGRQAIAACCCEAVAASTGTGPLGRTAPTPNVAGAGRAGRAAVHSAGLSPLQQEGMAAAVSHAPESA